IKTIHEISRCRDFEEYKTMAEANFNLVLHQESRYAAEDFNDRLKIPFIELRRLYQTDKIQNQYQALASVLGISFELDEYREAAEQGIEDFRKVCPDASFAVGECMNGDPFELALALLKYGFKVPIYGTITVELVYMKQLALGPGNEGAQYGTNHDHYDPRADDITIGTCLYYHQDCPGLMGTRTERRMDSPG
ncbi:MAG: nitrogenase component 1, partial [Blautia obeum]